MSYIAAILAVKWAVRLTLQPYWELNKPSVYYFRHVESQVSCTSKIKHFRHAWSQMSQVSSIAVMLGVKWAARLKLNISAMLGVKRAKRLTLHYVGSQVLHVYYCRHGGSQVSGASNISAMLGVGVKWAKRLALPSCESQVSHASNIVLQFQ